jgi:hypothetical protein
MKTEWRFTYQAKDFFFQKEFKYLGQTGELQLDTDAPPQKLSFEIRIDPDNPYKRPGIEQTGSFYLTLPLPYEKAKPHASALAQVIAERISFESGHFRLVGGVISCKRIPETPEEEREVGDKPYAVEMRIIEVPETPQFHSKAFTEKSNLNMDIGLVSQHNSARMAKNPIDKFLGFFKIIEAQFASRCKEPIHECLSKNADLLGIYKSTFNFATEDQALTSFLEFVSAIVKARHQCAHLKSDKKFGYVPIDPRLKVEVEPFLVQLQVLTYHIILNSAQRITPP